MKFSDIIDNSIIRKFARSKLDVLETIDPDRIYVENIRSFYGLPTFMAKFLCEMAVRQNLFIKRVGVECPNEGRIITTAENKDKLPKQVHCLNCELQEKDKYQFDLSECQVTEFYKLNVR